eukprot:TRINITY_DN2167_c0_g1_i1.p1 TRINITY_DN2167_c0_g1~~TRINITY_DN2167_c0_g1_i1.p1  ORF type:complete len:872 (+),score=182.95 TRINITY_DN2167_c0_g1_i1:400-3015(+)
MSKPKRQALHISPEFLAPLQEAFEAEEQQSQLQVSPRSRSNSASTPQPHQSSISPRTLSQPSLPLSQSAHAQPQLQHSQPQLPPHSPLSHSTPVAKYASKDMPSVTATLTLSEPKPVNERMEGWLMKWTTVVKGGWKKRYFVLSGASGSLIYYLDSQLKRQKGSVSLINSRISVNKKDDTAFVIESTGTKPCWLKAERPEDRDRWIPALVAVAKAMMEPDTSSADLVVPTTTITALPSEIFTKVTANVQECSDPVADLQALIQTAEAEKADLERELALIQQIKEQHKRANQETDVLDLAKRASVLTHLVTAILQSLEPIVDVVAAIQEKNKFLQTTVYGLEKEREEIAEKMKELQQGAILKGDKKRAELVKTLSRSLDLHSPDDSDEDEDEILSSVSYNSDEEYFDAEGDGEDWPTVPSTIPKIEIHSPSPKLNLAKKSESDIVTVLDKEPAPPAPLVVPHHLPAVAISEPIIHTELAVLHGIEPPPLTITFGSATKRRRVRLPANKSNEKISIWSLVKEAVGKDISRVTLPVILCEPISFLQRSAEDFEYSDLIDVALTKADPFLRMVYVACFAISGYSSTERTGKPFNPLLGETFELVRPEKKFRMIVEQVTHHPPACAIHTEGDGYVFWTDVVVKNKFWGKSLEVFPTGTLHLKFTKLGDSYKWHKVTTCVNNIMIGTPWIDNYGTMEIVNSTENIKCKIEFIKKGWFDSGGGAKVEGKVMDSKGNTRYEIKGKWNESLSAVSVANGEKFDVWKKNPLPQLAAEQYQMTQFAIQMNDPYEEDLQGYLPQTDTRLRPDTRALENGDVELAGKEKSRLEEKQRATRREMESRNQEWQPRWFKKEGDEWIYVGGYWRERQDKNFQNVPNIF